MPFLWMARQVCLASRQLTWDGSFQQHQVPCREEGDKRFNTTLAQLHSGPVPLATSPAATSELSSSGGSGSGGGASSSNVNNEGSAGCSSRDAGGANTGDSSGAGTDSSEHAGALCCVEQPSTVSSSLTPWRGSQWQLDPEQIKIGKRIAVGGFAEVFLGKYQVGSKQPAYLL